MKKYYVDTIDEFNNIIIKYDEPRFVFRGVANAEYSLEPSLLFIGNKCNFLTIEREEEVIDYLLKKYSNRQAYEVLMEARHFGLYSRFCDFTFSYPVALYFACSNNEDADCKLFILDSFKYLKTENKRATNNGILTNEDVINSLLRIIKFDEWVIDFFEKGSKKFEFPILLKPDFYSTRIANQSGLFLMWVDLMFDCKKLDPYLTQIIISNSLKSELINWLKYKKYTENVIIPEKASFIDKKDIEVLNAYLIGECDEIKDN